jgi:hypothetical protein
MRPIERGPVPRHITRSGRGQTVTVENYGFFAGELIARLGEYCSYCEVELGANLAIEHILARSGNPHLEVDWGNLLLACPNCNSRKSTQVQNRQNYYWPDTVYPGFNTFSMLDYYIGQVGSDNVVLVRPKAGTSADRAKVQATIDLLDLNHFVAADDDPKASDRRVWNRTKTWNIAVSMASTLSRYYTKYDGTGNDVQAVANALADPAINILQRQITIAALAGGFWSVWVTVFSTTGMFITQGFRDTLLQTLFVTPFPGTRYP